MDKGLLMTKKKHDEAEFTPWCKPGWTAWDAVSPEVEFCEFVGTLQKFLEPAVVVETGVGIGRLTSYLDLEACEWLGYEAEGKYRLTDGVQQEETPPRQVLERADFVVLDSNPPHRQNELWGWIYHGKPGSVCIVHDAGNGHPGDTFHADVGNICRASNVPGVFLKNPRGAWLGIH